MRELAMFCHFQKLPILAPQHSATASKPSINTLAEHFVARLQATVPSSVSTILRTACKLQVLQRCPLLFVCMSSHLQDVAFSKPLMQAWQGSPASHKVIQCQPFW